LGEQTSSPACSLDQKPAPDFHQRITSKTQSLKDSAMFPWKGQTKPGQRPVDTRAPSSFHRRLDCSICKRGPWVRASRSESCILIFRELLNTTGDDIYALPELREESIQNAPQDK
jgi:hypothetical protein